jgi:hypothetical protein
MGRGAVSEVRGAEEWLAAIEDVIRRYRGHSADPDTPALSHAEALERMRDLGLADGEAERWLAPKPRYP